MSNEDASNNPSPAVLELLAKVPPEVLSGLVSAVANAHSSNKDSTSTAPLTASTVAMTAGPSSVPPGFPASASVVLQGPVSASGSAVPVLYMPRSDLSQEIAALPDRKFPFLYPEAPKVHPRLEFGQWDPAFQVQNEALLQPFKLGGSKQQGFRFFPSLYFQTNAVYLSEMIPEGQVIGILHCVEAGVTVVAVGVVEDGHNVISFYDFSAVNASSCPPSVPWTSDFAVRQLNNVFRARNNPGMRAPLTIGSRSETGPLSLKPKSDMQELSSSLSMALSCLTDQVGNVCSTISKTFKRGRKGNKKESGDEVDEEDDGVEEDVDNGKDNAAKEPTKRSARNKKAT